MIHILSLYGGRFFVLLESSMCVSHFIQFIRLVPVPPLPLQELHQSWHYSHRRQRCLLFFVTTGSKAGFRLSVRCFQRTNYLIRTYTFRCFLWTCKLEHASDCSHPLRSGVLSTKSLRIADPKIGVAWKNFSSELLSARKATLPLTHSGLHRCPLV